MALEPDDPPTPAWESRALVGLAATALLLPLAVAPGAFIFPYVTSKALLLGSVACGMLAVLGIGWMRGVLGPPRPGPVAWAGAALLGSAVLSTALGVDPAAGIWDTGERMTGLVTYGAAAVLFLGIVAIGRRRGTWRGFLVVTLATAWATTATGALQSLGLVADDAARIASTLGHPGYFGMQGLHTVFAALLLASISESRWMRWFAAVSVAAGLGALLLSETRATALGLAAGLAAWASWTFLARSVRARRAGLCVLAILGLAGVGFVAVRDQPFAQSIPLVRRAATSARSSRTLETRLVAWDVALDAGRDRPLLGWGPNSYRHAFSAHFRPALQRYGAAQTWFDDAHSVVFTTLAEQGLLGLAALAGLVCAAVVAIHRAHREGRIRAGPAAAVAGWMVSHLVALLFTFEDLSSLTSLVLVLAYCEQSSTPKEPSRPVPQRLAGVALLAAAAAAFVVTQFRPALANFRTRAACAQLSRDPWGAVETMTAADSLAPSSLAESNAAAFATLAHPTILQLAAAGHTREADALGRGAFDLLAVHAVADPPRIQATLQRTAIFDATPTLRDDRAASAAVEDDLRRANAFAPRRLDVRFALAAMCARSGRAAEAADLLRGAVEDAPDNSEAWTRLASVYRRAGRVDEARRVIAQALSAGVVFTDEERAILGDPPPR